MPDPLMHATHTHLHESCIYIQLYAHTNMNAPTHTSSVVTNLRLRAIQVNFQVVVNCQKYNILVSGSITFLLSVYGMTTVFGIWYFTAFDKAKLHKENCIGKHCLRTYPRHTEICT